MRQVRRISVSIVSLLALFMLAVPAFAETKIEVSPITATLDLPSNTTEYTIQILAPAGTDVQVDWKKPSCGTWERPAPTLLRWTHPHPPCLGPLLHAEETITVTVTVLEHDVRFTCTYVGADDGVGPECTSKSLGLATSPTPSASAAPPTASAPPSVEPVASSGIGDYLPLIGFSAALAGVILLIVLVVTALRRRRERALDPCAPRQRRGMGYLAQEIEAYAEQNRHAAMRAAEKTPLEFPAGVSIEEFLSDLWPEEGDRATRAAWSAVLGTDESLVRSTRSPQLAARSRGWLGPEGTWRASAEAVASRITRRTGSGYTQARSAGWAGSFDAITSRLGAFDLPVAAAIAANAFASAAIAAADALERLNEASQAAGCPTVPMPEVRFVTIPAEADPSVPGTTFLVHSLTGGEAGTLPAEGVTRGDLSP